MADEDQRDLATNRLLEIIRGKGGVKPGQSTEPPAPSRAAPSSEPSRSEPAPSRSGALTPKLSGLSGTSATEPAFPPPPKPEPTPEAPARRPGMGLLDKVLAKPSSQPSRPTPVQAPSAPAGVKPETAPRPSVAPSPPAPRPAPTTTAPPTRVIERKSRDTAEPAPDSALPDSLLPFPQRILKRLKSSKPAVKLPTGGVGQPSKPIRIEKPPAPKAVVKAKGKRIFSVDFGTSSVKVVELVRQGNRIALAGLYMSAIPVAMRKNPATLPILQTKLLREMIPSDRIKGAEFHVVIQDKSAQSRTVSIPGGAAKELVNAIKFQIKKDLPFPLDNCEIAYNGFDPKLTGKQEFEILAADRRAIETPLGILEEMDLLPSVVTSAPTAAQFLIKDYTGIASGPGAVVLADIGASKTTITIVDSDRVVLSRTVLTGGDDFTNVLTGVAIGPNGEEFNDLQAEKYKIDIGLPAERDPSAAMMKSSILMRPIAERIATEINRSLDFYRRERPSGEIKKIILCGGGALLKRLPEFLSENIGAEIVLGTPAARLMFVQGTGEAIELAATESGPFYLPALAVALDEGKAINMLPQKVRSALRLRAARGVIAPAAFAVMILLVSIYALAVRQRMVTEVEYEKIKSQLSDLDLWRTRSFAAEEQFNKLASELGDRQSDYDSIKTGDPEVSSYLKAFSNLVPENVYLEKLETKFLPEVASDSSSATSSSPAPGGGSFGFESMMSTFTKSFGNPLSGANSQQNRAAPVKRPVFGRVIELNGTIYPFGTMTDVQLVDFVFSLENSGHFRDVAVDSMAVIEAGKVKFRIICGI